MLLYRRGRRAEALTIAAVCACYSIYNSGYYLPFGGGAPGPRFMITLLPFLACPLGLALRRWPGPTIALAGISITAWTIVTITHPLVGYENETVVWTRLLSKGEFQPTIATALGAGRGWSGIWPFLLAVAGAVALAGAATPRLRLSTAALGAGVLAVLAWALFAALGPTALGIDHQGLLEHRQSGRRHSAQPHPAQRRALPAHAAHALLRGRRRSRPWPHVARAPGARRRRCGRGGARCAYRERRGRRLTAARARQFLAVVTAHFAPWSCLQTTR